MKKQRLIVGISGASSAPCCAPAFVLRLAMPDPNPFP